MEVNRFLQLFSRAPRSDPEVHELKKTEVSLVLSLPSQGAEIASVILGDWFGDPYKENARKQRASGLI